MKRYTLLLTALVSIAGCQPGATTTAGAAFNVQPLSETDIQIQGCSRTLSRTSAADPIFAEDSVDAGAKGFIRVDGQLIDVGLTAASGDQQHSTRNFADADHTIEIVESLTSGAAHEESDSVEESGALAITYHGATQTIPVEGGAAC